jgi:hypothetical protein
MFEGICDSKTQTSNPLPRLSDTHRTEESLKMMRYTELTKSREWRILNYIIQHSDM